MAHELDDDALDDGGDEQMTFEEEEQMKYALADVHRVIGPADATGISDYEIKDALWEYYFNVDKTVQWALDEVEKRRVAAERRAQGYDPQNLPAHDQGYADPSMYGQPPMRSGPKIFEHQQNLTIDIPEADQRNRRGWDLSTIAEEQSVLTATSTRWTNHAGDTSFPEMYEPDHAGWQPEQLDPNTSRPSPTLSGLARLSEFHDAPSNSSINPDTDDSPIPIRLSSSTPRDTASDVSSAGTERPKGGSKLSRLASARSADAASVSSRSSGTSVKGSIKTFPNLRPSAQSERPTSMVSSVSSKSLPPLPSRSHSTTPSETSHLIRGAIETAMQLEAFDNEQLSRAAPMQPASSSSGNVQPVSSPPSDQVPQPSSRPLSMQSDKASTISSASTAKPVSKLAALAQQKAALKSKSPAISSPPLSLPSPTSSISAPRSLSKLAQLAQEKVDATKAPKLPKTTTEYLTPIANGSSVTTAITTSYHSLFSLTDPNKRPIIPALDVVPLSFAPPPSPSEKKTSKLAQKSKRPAQNAVAQTSPIEGIDTSAIPSALFRVQAPSPRASPSVFASTLIHTDVSTSKKGKEKKKGKGREESPEKRTPEPSPVESHPRRKHKQTASLPPKSESQTSQSFSFDGPSPDDIVLNARKGTAFHTAKEREKAQRAAATLAQRSVASSAVNSRATTPVHSPSKSTKKGPTTRASGTSTPLKKSSTDQQALDLSGLNLGPKPTVGPSVSGEETPKMAIGKERLLEEAQKALDAQSSGKRALSIVVIGHVDAGKSTLMGRLLYELGNLDEKTKRTNERESSKIGKSSFSWAWGLDGTLEERERGITMDIAQQALTTPNRQITVLDAPGHRDFIPNMISGASQADSALLVVDSSTGEFEAGFDRGGQTREHLLLVRSLGVAQVIVAVNKLDQVQWSEARFKEIQDALRPFLTQSGFSPSKTFFVPVSAMQGINLLTRGAEAKELEVWWKGPTLVDLLDKLEPPTRDIQSPFRFPISNVYRSQGSTVAVTGRLCSGVVQVGEKVRVLPGDETAIIKSIDVEEVSAPWVAAGSSATLYLTSIDPVNLNIGSVLCPLNDLVPLATTFTARVIVFDIQIPITAGTSVEVFTHSRDVPATTTKLVSILDRASGKVVKQNPRVLGKNVSAEVQISIRANPQGSQGPVAKGIPMEPFAVNRSMGRVLIRRGGETIAAGIVTEINA